MNPFAQALQQTPVSDKGKIDTIENLEDEFTVSKGKTLKGFNDDFSQISIESIQINDESINQMKKQLFQRQLDQNKRTKKIVNGNQKLVPNIEFQHAENNSTGFEIDKKKKNSLNQDLALESKVSQAPAVRVINLHQQLSVKVQSSHLPTSIKIQKKLTQIYSNLTEFKILKQRIYREVEQQSRKFNNLISKFKIALQTEVKRFFINSTLIQEQMASANYKKIKFDEETVLKTKLKEAESSIKQCQTQLSEVRAENQLMQQKLFDFQQKIVGIDLEVQRRLDKKRKQLEEEILQRKIHDLTDIPDLADRSSLIKVESRTTFNLSSKQDQEQVVRNLISQNEFHQKKIKSYQNLIIQSDEIKKTNLILEQRELILKKKQYELQIQKAQIKDHLKTAHQKFMKLDFAKSNFDKEMTELKNRLQAKELDLIKWDQQLSKKALEINQKQSHFNKNKSPHFQPCRYFQPQNLDARNSLECKLELFGSQLHPESKFLKEMKTVSFEQSIHQLNNTQKIKFKTIGQPTSQLTTVKQAFKNRIKTPKSFFTDDLHKFQSYKNFDRREKQKQQIRRTQQLLKGRDRLSLAIYENKAARSSQFGKRSQRQAENQCFRISSLNLSQSPEGKKIFPQFQYSNTNHFKYEYENAKKPLSTPLSKNISVRLSSYKESNLSPNRDYGANPFTNENLTYSHQRDKYYQSETQMPQFCRSPKGKPTQAYSQINQQANNKGHNINKIQGTQLDYLQNKIESLKNRLKSQIGSIH